MVSSEWETMFYAEDTTGDIENERGVVWVWLILIIKWGIAWGGAKQKIINIQNKVSAVSEGMGNNGSQQSQLHEYWCEPLWDPSLQAVAGEPKLIHSVHGGNGGEGDAQGRSRGKQIEGEYYVLQVINNNQEQEIAVYKERKIGLHNIVSVYDFYVNKDMLGCARSALCYSVITERVHYRLDSLPGLNSQELLYIYHEALCGYEQISKYGRLCYPNSNKIGVKENGEVKVWVNENWASNTYIKCRSERASMEALWNCVKLCGDSTQEAIGRCNREMYEMESQVDTRGGVVGFEDGIHMMRTLFGKDIVEGKFSLQAKLKELKANRILASVPHHSQLHNPQPTVRPRAYSQQLRKSKNSHIANFDNSKAGSGPYGAQGQAEKPRSTYSFRQMAPIYNPPHIHQQVRAAREKQLPTTYHNSNSRSNNTNNNNNNPVLSINATVNMNASSTIEARRPPSPITIRPSPHLYADGGKRPQPQKLFQPNYLNILIQNRLHSNKAQQPIPPKITYSITHAHKNSNSNNVMTNTANTATIATKTNTNARTNPNTNTHKDYSIPSNPKRTQMDSTPIGDSVPVSTSLPIVVGNMATKDRDRDRSRVNFSYRNSQIVPAHFPPASYHKHQYPNSSQQPTKFEQSQAPPVSLPFPATPIRVSTTAMAYVNKREHQSPPLQEQSAGLAIKLEGLGYRQQEYSKTQRTTINSPPLYGKSQDIWGSRQLCPVPVPQNQGNDLAQIESTTTKQINYYSPHKYTIDSSQGHELDSRKVAEQFKYYLRSVEKSPNQDQNNSQHLVAEDSNEGINNQRKLKHIYRSDAPAIPQRWEQQESFSQHL